MRLIDADALLLDNTWEWYDEYGNMTQAGKAIHEAPTIDPVKYGEWIEEPDRRFHWHCSECGYVIGVVKMDCNYCPNCGDKMDGDDNEAD